MVAHLSGDGAVGVDLNLRRSESFKEGFCPFGIVIMHLCDCRALRRERVTAHAGAENPRKARAES